MNWYNIWLSQWKNGFSGVVASPNEVSGRDLHGHWALEATEQVYLPGDPLTLKWDADCWVNELARFADHQLTYYDQTTPLLRSLHFQFSSITTSRVTSPRFFVFWNVRTQESLHCSNREVKISKLDLECCRYRTLGRMIAVELNTAWSDDCNSDFENLKLRV